MNKILKYSTFLWLAFLLAGCQSIPKGATAVTSFKANKYIGTWYEVARMEFLFEKHLTNTTATYGLLDNGKISVLNEGYDTLKTEWTNANGKAKFKALTDVAELKVSFFGPFYAGYNVIALAGDYEYALVTGKNTDFLWILSRKTSIPENIKKDFLKQAKAIGYDTSELIWVAHDKIKPS